MHVPNIFLASNPKNHGNANTLLSSIVSSLFLRYIYVTRQHDVSRVFIPTRKWRQHKGYLMSIFKQVWLVSKHMAWKQNSVCCQRKDSISFWKVLPINTSFIYLVWMQCDDAIDKKLGIFISISPNQKTKWFEPHCLLEEKLYILLFVCYEKNADKSVNYLCWFFWKPGLWPCRERGRNTTK